MAYVPGCAADVFISYSHPDDHDGGVSKLKERFASRLQSHLTDVRVSFDSDIDPGESFQRRIQEELKKTPVFIAVVSPHFVKSTFCMEKELEWFRSQGGEHVIQLVIVPMEQQGLEIPLPQSLYVKLYGDDLRPLTRQRLDSELLKVVLAVKNRLTECRDARPKVYVAQIRHQNEAVQGAWDGLKQRLHEVGFDVLPQQVLIGGSEQYINRCLEKSGVSIHLRSVPDDQLASRQLDFARRVARPFRVLERPPRAEEVGELIASIRGELQGQRKPAVYFIYDDHSDGPRVSQLSREITVQTGLEVLTPEPSETYHVATRHKDRLRTSDGILLFQCDAPEDWRDAQEQVLSQCLALRRGPGIPVARYSTRTNGSPAGVLIQQPSPKEWIIERTGDVDVGDLRPFLEALAR